MVFGQNLPRRRRDFFADDADVMPAPRLSRMLDSVFSDFLGARSSMSNLGFDQFSPRVNVTENENELCVTAELPGMNEDDVDVTLVRDGILLRGERREERKEGQNAGYYEFSYGSFERFIPLRSDIDRENVEAEFDRGLLTITLPKTEQSRAQSKKIEVRKGEGKSKSQAIPTRDGSEKGRSEKRQASTRESASGEQRGSEERAQH